MRSHLLAFASLALISTALADEYTNPHVVEQKGVVVGIAWSPTGSQPQALTGRPVGQPAAAGLGAHVQRVSLYGNDPMFDLVIAALHGQESRGAFDIAYIGKDATGEKFTLDLSGYAMVLPECDVDSKDPRTAILSALHVSPPVRSGETLNMHAAKIDAKKQKQWLPANFRLRVGTIDTTRVNKVNSITMRLVENGDLDGDGAPDIVVESSRIEFNLPNHDSAPFQTLFEETLAGRPSNLPLRIEYLDDDGNILLSLEAEVQVVGIGPRDVFMPITPDGSTQVMLRARGIIVKKPVGGSGG